ncbi:MAG: NAD-dependent epimerase/dehydratase family protein [Candidatus Altiarchaeota archaeon]
MNLKDKSVLVTGGAGFIGSHLVDRIIKEHPQRLTLVDNFFLGKKENIRTAKKKFPKLRVYCQDAADQKAMSRIISKEGIDVVFNLAVVPLPASLIKPKWSFEKNIGITMTMAELARAGKFKTLIHFSSSEVYGTSEYAPMDENHPLNGTTPYAASKAASDQLVLSYIRTYGIDAAIVRPFNNYGPRQNDRSYAGVIPLTIKRILTGRPLVIFGDGKQTRDYLYVTDTVDAAVKVYNSRNTRGKVLNIASGKEISILQVIQTICKIMGCVKQLKYEPQRLGDVRRHIANISLATDLIRFEPKVGLYEGMKNTVEYYSKQKGI